LNGVKIGQHKGWNDPFDVPIMNSSLLTNGKPNILTVLVENTDNTGGLDKPVSKLSYAYSAPITGWKMRGGTTYPSAKEGWKTVETTAPPADGPRLFSTTFTATPPAATGAYPILRATFAGLSHGFMYLNGHNLGRYPEKVPIDGIYLPECWLNKGQNTLTILDEDGIAPTGVKLQVENAASRTVTELTASK
jgi:beta-galactosidase